MANKLKELIKQMVKDEKVCCADCLHDEVQEAYDEAVDELVQVEIDAETLDTVRINASFALADYFNHLFEDEDAIEPETIEETLKEMEEKDFPLLLYLLNKKDISGSFFKIRGIF